MFGLEALTFNIHGGYLEAVVRGYRSGLLTATDYHNLSQCETLDDIVMHLSATEYATYLQNVPSSWDTTTLVEKCTRKLVAEYKYLLAQATKPLSTFLEYITYGYMIDNVVMILIGTLNQRDNLPELLNKCHPLGMFDSIATLTAADQDTMEIYRLLLDTPLAPYFSQILFKNQAKPEPIPEMNQNQNRYQNLEDMNCEIMRSALYKAYLEDFYRFCQKLGGATETIMCDLLALEADRRAIDITINSFGSELKREELKKLYPNFGSLYPEGHQKLAACDDIIEVRDAVEMYKSYESIFSKLTGEESQSQMLDRAFNEEEVKRLCSAFECQFHYAVFYAYTRLREMEIKNLMWISECVTQNQKSRIQDSLVFIF